MKFGMAVPGLILYPPVTGDWEYEAKPSDTVRVAKKADELGFEWLTVPEHIIMPSEMTEVMGPRYPEAMGAGAFLAGATSRIKILTYILVLPYRNPILLAKQISTIDALSGGRIVLGTGVGHLAKEFEALKIPFKERGAMTDEYLRIMKERWAADEPSFDGKYFRFDNLAFEPKPASKPHPPLLIGGNSKPAMRRAATLGDGWMPWLIKPHQIPEHLEYIQEQPAFQDRDRPFEVVSPLVTLNVEDYSHRELGKTKGPKSSEGIIEQIGVLEEAGVTGVLVGPGRKRSIERYLEWMDWFAEEVMPNVG
jgi:probable F420-dependent oxidoreductase